MLFRQQRRIFSMHRIARRIASHKAKHESTASQKSASLINRGELLAGDLYQFGVYTGGGLKAWLDGFPALNISFTGRVWGFDSFVGMPHETNASTYQTPSHLKNSAWQPGGLNATAQLHAPSWADLEVSLLRNLGHSDRETHFIRGFYNESLSEGAAFARRLGMKTALLVDIDCDLYSSTKQALEFMLASKLMVPGTFVYFDDTSDKTYQAVQKRHEAPLEELLAHREVTAAWGLKWRQLPALGGFPGPISGALSWVPQYAADVKGRLVPPEMYPPVVELQACRRCGELDNDEPLTS